MADRITHVQICDVMACLCMMYYGLSYAVDNTFANYDETDAEIMILILINCAHILFISIIMGVLLLPDYREEGGAISQTIKSEGRGVIDE